MKISRILKIAKKEALKSNHPKYKHGAVLVSKNKIIGKGFNSIKTHPSSFHPFKQIHAELSAIIKAGQKSLSHAILYVYREDSSGALDESKPCIFCQKMIEKKGIKTVIFTTKEGIRTAVFNAKKLTSCCFEERAVK